MDNSNAKMAIALHEECEFPYHHTRPILANIRSEQSEPNDEDENWRKIMKRDLSRVFFVDRVQWLLRKTRKYKRFREEDREREGI